MDNRSCSVEGNGKRVRPWAGARRIAECCSVIGDSRLESVPTIPAAHAAFRGCGRRRRFSRLCAPHHRRLLDTPPLCPKARSQRSYARLKAWRKAASFPGLCPTHLWPLPTHRGRPAAGREGRRGVRRPARLAGRCGRPLRLMMNACLRRGIEAMRPDIDRLRGPGRTLRSFTLQPPSRRAGFGGAPDNPASSCGMRGGR
jgi:hypothetical protein